MELINNKTLPEENIKIKELDYYEKVSIKDRIDKLTKEGKIEILRIISKNNEVYSENKNGIFFDITKLSNSTLLKIDEFLLFSETNKKELEKEEENRNLYRKELS